MAMKSKSLFALSLACTLGFGGAIIAPSSVEAGVPAVRKVALVDMQRVLNETKQGKKARSKLEKSSEAKSKKLESKRTKLEAEMKQAEGKSGAELAAAQEKLQRDYMELQQMHMQLQQDLAVQENELLEQIYKNSQSVVNGLAKEYGVDVVLIRDESTVLYADKSMDVTAELVKRYDKKYK
jgi:outer membrane protein